jgi:hypothetical protein
MVCATVARSDTSFGADGAVLSIAPDCDNRLGAFQKQYVCAASKVVVASVTTTLLHDAATVLLIQNPLLSRRGSCWLLRQKSEARWHD